MDMTLVVTGLLPLSLKWRFAPIAVSGHGAHVAGRSSRRGYVAFESVIHHHAVGAETPAQSADGALHALDPPSREPIAIAMVVERNHFFAKSTHEIFSVARVMDVHVRMRSADTNGEAVHAVIRLGPPAVENGEVEAAIEHGFLAAGARSLLRPARIVEPHINALHEMASNVDVIVFDKHELVAEFRIAHEVGNLLQDA